MDLEEDLKEGFFGEEEEAEARRVGSGDAGGDGDGGDSDGDVAVVGEPELLEEDHRPGVGVDL